MPDSRNSSTVELVMTILERKPEGMRQNDDCSVQEGVVNEVNGQPVSKSEGDSRTGLSYLSGPKLWTLMTCLTLVFFLVLLDTSIIATAIPQITSDFHALQDVGWYGSAYQLASASFQPLTGKFYARFESKWTFLVFFALFELGSLICGVAKSSEMFIAGRAVAGLGSSGLQNGALTIIADAVELKKRPLYTGILLGCAQLGIITGPLIGGALTEYSTWRWCFLLNLPVGAATALLLTIMPVPSTRPKTTTPLHHLLADLDLLGFAIFCPSIIMLLLAMQWGGTEHPWSSAVVIALFCSAGVLFLVFLAWEYRQGYDAMIPLSMVRQRIVWTSCAYIAILMGVLFAASYYLPIYFQAVKGDSPFLSGVHMLPSILSQLVTGVSSGVAVSKLGYYLPWSLGGGVLTVVGNGLLSTLSVGTPVAKWVGYQIVVGAGRGASMQMPIIAIQTNLPPKTLPLALSTTIFAQNLGGAISLCLANAIFANQLRAHLAASAPALDIAEVIAAGGSARAVRDLVAAAGPAVELRDVLLSFARSVDRVFVVLAGVAGGLVFLAFGMGVRMRVEGGGGLGAGAEKGEGEEGGRMGEGAEGRGLKVGTGDGKRETEEGKA